MYLTNRQKIGLIVMVTSVVAAVVIQVLSGRVADVRTVSDGESPSGTAMPEVVMVHVHGPYGIALAGGFFLGLACLAWPSRKPPRIAS